MTDEESDFDIDDEDLLRACEAVEARMHQKTPAEQTAFSAVQRRSTFRSDLQGVPPYLSVSRAPITHGVRAFHIGGHCCLGLQVRLSVGMRQ